MSQLLRCSAIWYTGWPLRAQWNISSTDRNWPYSYAFEESIACLCYNSDVDIRVVSPVQGEVVEVTRHGLEIISESALEPGSEVSILMKRDFQARRLHGRVRWCIARPSVEARTLATPFRHQFYLEARQMDPGLRRFLRSTSHRYRQGQTAGQGQSRRRAHHRESTLSPAGEVESDS